MDFCCEGDSGIQNECHRKCRCGRTLPTRIRFRRDDEHHGAHNNGGSRNVSEYRGNVAKVPDQTKQHVRHRQNQANAERADRLVERLENQQANQREDVEPVRFATSPECVG